MFMNFDFLKFNKEKSVYTHSESLKPAEWFIAWQFICNECFNVPDVGTFVLASAVGTLRNALKVMAIAEYRSSSAAFFGRLLAWRPRVVFVASFGYPPVDEMLAA